MEVVINECFGGYQLSMKGLVEYCTRKYGQFYIYERIRDEYVKTPYYPDMKQFRGGHFYYVVNTDLGETTSEIPAGSHVHSGSIERNDPILVDVVRDLGKEVNTDVSNLVIVEIPDDVDWIITEYDGSEQIEEKHRVWY